VIGDCFAPPVIMPRRNQTGMVLSKGRIAAFVAVLSIGGSGWVLWHPAIAPIEAHVTFPPQ
jgi:hypothetical protein